MKIRKWEKYIPSFIAGIIIGAIIHSFFIQQVDPRDELLLAISKGNIEKIKEIEEQNEDILDEWIYYDGLNYSGYFPIQYALYLNQVSVVFYMIERGVELNQIIGDGSPFNIAISRYNYPMMNRFLENGADVNFGRPSPLICAISNYASLKVKINLLTENGAKFLNEEEKKQAISLLENMDIDGMKNKINVTPVMPE